MCGLSKYSRTNWSQYYDSLETETGETIMMRLETVARDLSEKLRKASPTQQQAASFAACQLALQAASVDTPVVLESLEQLRQHGALSIQQIAELNDLAAQLDTKYFDLQDQAEINPDLQADALLFLVKRVQLLP